MESVTVLRAVMLSGGVFLNALLRTEATDRLAREEFRVHRHVRVPPGDGGLCLGQFVIASSRESWDNPRVPVPGVAADVSRNPW